jgi:sn-glycerol 3-phosphate transport system permease protein
MEKRARFKSAWLPYALVAPQLVLSVLFFFWPAAQALYQSVLLQDAFGSSVQFVWFENFQMLWNDPTYLESFKTTAVFSVSVAVLGLAISLIFAVFADRVVRGTAVYRTFLIWPYAVAPVVVGVLWMFLLSPSLGIISHALRPLGIEWNHALNGRHAMILIVIAAVWKQISYNFLFFLAGLQSIPKSLIEAAAIDGAGPVRRFFSIVFPLLSPTSFFLLVINIVYAFFDTFGIIYATNSGGPCSDT